MTSHLSGKYLFPRVLKRDRNWLCRGFEAKAVCNSNISQFFFISNANIINKKLILKCAVY